MEFPNTQAAQAWQAALKLRKHLTKQLEKLPKDGNSGIDLTQFEAVDSLLEKFRLACVQTIFLDFEYAIQEKTEVAMWTIHTSINHEYRRILGRLKAPAHVVEKRKIEKFYNNFLRIAQKFYKGYIQRLSARYEIHELKRVAQGIGVEQLNAGDTISPVPAQTSAQVLQSCHLTLIRLGDLARYRVQARYKKSSYDMALTYYSLAHDLVPDSGFAFHQIGIVHLDEGKHLEVIYDFYRSWAVEKSHPNAKQNLEAEFKTLRSPNPSNSRNTASTGPHDAFIMWFAKLHAFFYKGEVFPQHGELETEVMHRLRMASKSADAGDVLFKMILTNILAYHVACNKYTETQSENASHFCQYTLRLSVRFILTFSETLELELMEIVNRESVPGEQNTKTSPVIETILPLFRTYLMWLAAHQHEVVGATDIFGPLVPGMIKSLAKVFSLLCADTYTQEILASCPYMLTEDLQTQGLRPLRDEQIPRTCRFYTLEDGATKPRLESPELRLGPFQETLARILDVLRCAYCLADDANTPMACRVTEKGLVFEYQEVVENGQLQAAEPAAVFSQPLAMDHGPEVSDYQGMSSMSMPLDSRPLVNHTSMPTPAAASIERYEMDAAEDQAQDTVLSMLAPFLEPTPVQRNHFRSPEESSYGMHTATANDVFGQFPVAEPSPTGSIPSGKFESLPWDWVYTPTPNKPQESLMNSATTRGAFAAQPTGSPNYSAGVPAQAVNGIEDPFATPSRQPQGGYTPRTASNMMGSPPVGLPVSLPVPSPAEEAHRNQLLQSLTSPNGQRTSTFSHWGQNSSWKPKETMPGANSPHGYRTASENYPMSSAISGFSHPSSLYQGTPANAASFGMPTSGGRYGQSRAEQAPTSQENGGSSSSMRFQMEDTTSSYDKAVLQGAFYNK
ncbi:Fc.00g112120.m01.CDS01 [Cosmosporella sp. VM-42]